MRSPAVCAVAVAVVAPLRLSREAALCSARLSRSTKAEFLFINLTGRKEDIELEKK